ncbi:sensor domain-containing diguanylate cyclase/phosphohydrolase [Halonatronum saccharophilum]|uniref:sensor domain-containing diguanylate cyclase/phosphohydrolase n=1 Tax=Halonatronum saccharophilum TaxID=150060 RepID=UPI0004B05622|nr:HD domain-containing phosphohydrolase [Halonatronum saccharophilum]
MLIVNGGELGLLSIFTLVVIFLLIRKNFILRDKLNKKKTILNNCDVYVWCLKTEETYGIVNKPFSDFLGFDKKEVENNTIRNVLKERKAKEEIAKNKRAFTEKEVLITEENYTNDRGEERILNVTRSPELDKRGNVQRVICSAYDITFRKNIEKKIEYASFHDTLTGLYNRFYFENHLPQIDKEENLPISIIIGDINGLKLANDVFGHKVGDRLLKKVAQIFKEATRSDDLVVRWGGDEFSIILPNTDNQGAQKIIDRIKKRCKSCKALPFSPDIALGSATKYEINKSIKDLFSEGEDKMYKRKEAAKEGLDNPVLNSLMDRFLNNGFEEKKHISRVKQLSLELAKKMNLSDNLLEKLLLLSDFHDIGKLTLDSELLNKKEELDREEIKELKTHVKSGYNIAKNFQSLNKISEFILYHHENWDGSGYPQGLKGEEIPLLSRMLRIVDAYDKMIYGNSYKDPISKEEALSKLKKGSGIKYDPNIVKEFIEVI